MLCERVQELKKKAAHLTLVHYGTILTADKYIRNAAHSTTSTSYPVVHGHT